MTSDERMFFNTTPGALPLYEVLRNKLLTECPDTTLQVQKSQITFKVKYGYAFVSLRRMKAAPEVFLIVTFGLSHRLDSPRIAAAVEPYPNRWTHPHHRVRAGPAGRRVDGLAAGGSRFCAGERRSALTAGSHKQGSGKSRLITGRQRLHEGKEMFRLTGTKIFIP